MLIKMSKQFYLVGDNFQTQNPSGLMAHRYREFSLYGVTFRVVVKLDVGEDSK